METQELNTVLQQSINKVQMHGDKLLQQNMEFMKQIASLETQQKAFEGRLDRQQQNIEQQLDRVENNLTNELHNIVGEQINALVSTSTAHQDTLVRLTTIQENQQKQIDAMQTQINELAILRHDITELTGRVSAAEEKVASLEQSVMAQAQNQADVNKTRIQGRWALITAIATGIIALASTFITALI